MTDTKPKLFTPEAILGQFPNLFEQGLPDDRGNRYYETDLLFSPGAQQTPAWANLRAAAAAAMKEKFPGGLPDGWKSPFRKASSKLRQKDGSAYYPEDQFPGWMFIRVKSKNQPGMVDAQVQPIIEPSEVYGGCHVRCTVNPFAFQVKGNSGVSFWLNNVQVLSGPKTGDPVIATGGSRATDDFEAVGDVSGQDVDAMFDAA